MATKTTQRMCSTEGCGEIHYAKGICKKHYDARRDRRGYNRDYYHSHKTEISAQREDYYFRNAEKLREYSREYVRANPERAKESVRSYRQTPQGKRVSRKHVAYRRARKNQATPPWLSPQQRAEIDQVYRTCPEGFHVDHVIPLKGEDVCGLHVPWNLQHLPIEENLRKGNKLLEKEASGPFAA